MTIEQAETRLKDYAAEQGHRTAFWFIEYERMTHAAGLRTVSSWRVAYYESADTNANDSIRAEAPNLAGAMARFMPVENADAQFGQLVAVEE